MATRCCSARCSAERKGFRRELDSWRHKLIHCVGFESILEGIYGQRLLQDLSIFVNCEPEATADWSTDACCSFCNLQLEKISDRLPDSPPHAETPPQGINTSDTLQCQADQFLHAVLHKKEFPESCDPIIPLAAQELMRKMIRQFAVEYAHKIQTTESQNAVTQTEPDGPLDLTLSRSTPSAQQDGVLDLSKKNTPSLNTLAQQRLSGCLVTKEGESKTKEREEGHEQRGTALEEVMKSLCANHRVILLHILQEMMSFPPKEEGGPVATQRDVATLRSKHGGHCCHADKSMCVLNSCVSNGYVCSCRLGVCAVRSVCLCMKSCSGSSCRNIRLGCAGCCACSRALVCQHTHICDITQVAHTDSNTHSGCHSPSPPPLSPKPQDTESSGDPDMPMLNTHTLNTQPPPLLPHNTHTDQTHMPEMQAKPEHIIDLMDKFTDTLMGVSEREWSDSGDSVKTCDDTHLTEIITTVLHSSSEKDYNLKELFEQHLASEKRSPQTRSQRRQEVMQAISRSHDQAATRRQSLQIKRDLARLEPDISRKKKRKTHLITHGTYNKIPGSPISHAQSPDMPILHIQQPGMPISHGQNPHTQSPDTPISHTQSSDTPISHTQSSDTPISHAQSLDTPISPAQHPDTPIPHTESPDTSISPAQSLDTPICHTQHPDTPIPYTQCPDTPISQAQYPGTPISHTQIPDTLISHAKIPDTPISHAQSPDMPTSHTQSPDTPISHTQIPDTPISHTQIPDMPISHTQSPDTHIQSPNKLTPQTQSPDMPIFISCSQSLDMPQNLDSPISHSQITDMPISNSQSIDISISLPQSPGTPISNTHSSDTPISNVQRPDIPMSYTQSPDTPVLCDQKPNTPISHAQSPDIPISHVQTTDTPILQAQTIDTPILHTQSPDTTISDAQSPGTPSSLDYSPDSTISYTQSLETAISHTQSPDTPSLHTYNSDTTSSHTQSPEMPSLHNQSPEMPSLHNQSPEMPSLHNQSPEKSEACGTMRSRRNIVRPQHLSSYVTEPRKMFYAACRSAKNNSTPTQGTDMTESPPSAVIGQLNTPPVSANDRKACKAETSAESHAERQLRVKTRRSEEVARSPSPVVTDSTVTDPVDADDIKYASPIKLMLVSTIKDEDGVKYTLRAAQTHSDEESFDPCVEASWVRNTLQEQARDETVQKMSNECSEKLYREEFANTEGLRDCMNSINEAEPTIKRRPGRPKKLKSPMEKSVKRPIGRPRKCKQVDIINEAPSEDNEKPRAEDAPNEEDGNKNLKITITYGRRKAWRMVSEGQIHTEQSKGGRASTQRSNADEPAHFTQAQVSMNKDQFSLVMPVEDRKNLMHSIVCPKQSDSAGTRRPGRPAKVKISGISVTVTTVSPQQRKIHIKRDVREPAKHRRALLTDLESNKEQETITEEEQASVRHSVRERRPSVHLLHCDAISRPNTPTPRSRKLLLQKSDDTQQDAQQHKPKDANDTMTRPNTSPQDAVHISAASVESLFDANLQWWPTSASPETLKEEMNRRLRVMKETWVSDTSDVFTASSSSADTSDVFTASGSSADTSDVFTASGSSAVRMLFERDCSMETLCSWFMQTTETQSLAIIKKANNRNPCEVFQYSSAKANDRPNVCSSPQAERLRKCIKKFATVVPKSPSKLWRTQAKISGTQNCFTKQHVLNTTLNNTEKLQQNRTWHLYKTALDRARSRFKSRTKNTDVDIKSLNEQVDSGIQPTSVSEHCVLNTLQTESHRTSTQQKQITANAWSAHTLRECKVFLRKLNSSNTRSMSEESNDCSVRFSVSPAGNGSVQNREQGVRKSIKQEKTSNSGTSTRQQSKVKRKRRHSCTNVSPPSPKQQRSSRGVMAAKWSDFILGPAR
ncbi:uncharacterized protein lcorl isoform X2 [Tachysurus fulvidraco]|uniref:uncharacterized protein lcorl isoform X2 n=1 Tax=Tachysurus fulvidraco TaxID=1234273 RepID=UPI001FEE9241|nr:uncharacterized protein lcorl isoform X2 [Tachysurus fulvidraco]